MAYLLLNSLENLSVFGLLPSPFSNFSVALVTLIQGSLFRFTNPHDWLASAILILAFFCQQTISFSWIFTEAIHTFFKFSVAISTALNYLSDNCLKSFSSIMPVFVFPAIKLVNYLLFIASFPTIFQKSIKFYVIFSVWGIVIGVFCVILHPFFGTKDIVGSDIPNHHLRKDEPTCKKSVGA